MKQLSLLFLSLGVGSSLAADVPAAADVMPSAEQGFFQTLTMISVAIIFFYFILWRPEQKRRKALEQLRSSMKKGDRAIAMGIIGTISRVTEQTVVLRMVDGSEIEVLKAAISEVTPPGAQDAKKE